MIQDQMHRDNALRNVAGLHYAWDWYMPVADFNRSISNHNPKRDRAHAIAAEVRARRPEMQVKRIAEVVP